MKFPSFLFKNKETPLWPQFPSCNNQPKTSSFRASATDILITLDPSCPTAILPESSTLSEHKTEEFDSIESVETEDCYIEKVVLGLKTTERLFFKPEETNSLLEEANKTEASKANAAVNSPTFKEKSMVCSMDSVNPYLDFKKSMAEMIEAHKMSKKWDCLEELLYWYLKVNGKHNRCYIISAFVDLILELSISVSTTTSCSSPLSCTYSCDTVNSSSTTGSSSSLPIENNVEDENLNHDRHQKQHHCSSV